MNFDCFSLPFFACRQSEVKMKKEKMLPEDSANTAKAVEKPNFSLIDENFLKSRIYTIRGVKVMLDADLAEIYGYETRFFNRQVKNNIERFAEDFRFQLTEKELQNLMCKKCTSSWGGVRKLPYAFTEQGIYMLMTVLKGDLAVRQSMALIRLFKQMKDYIVTENNQLLGNDGIAQIALQTAQNTRDIAEHSADIRELSGEVYDMRENLGKVNLDLQKVMENFIDPTTFKHFLILDGQKLEADIAYMKIYGMAKKNIVIIDNYLGVKTLDLLRGIAKGISIRIISNAKGCAALTPDIVNDFSISRPDINLTIQQTSRKFHDRYIFLDYDIPNEKLFHCGASSKDAGNKITTIMQIECPEIYHILVE